MNELLYGTSLHQMKSHANTDFLRVVNGTRHKRVSRKWFIRLVFFILRCKITTNGFSRHLWLLIFINIEINIRGKSYYKLHENAENFIEYTKIIIPKLYCRTNIESNVSRQYFKPLGTDSKIATSGAWCKYSKPGRKDQKVFAKVQIN